jgi:hypothetical protein
MLTDAPNLHPPRRALREPPHRALHGQPPERPPREFSDVPPPARILVPGLPRPRLQQPPEAGREDAAPEGPLGAAPPAVVPGNGPERAAGGGE